MQDVVIKIPETDYKIMTTIAQKKRMSLERYCSDSATASIPADLDEIYGTGSRTYKRMMARLGIKLKV